MLRDLLVLTVLLVGVYYCFRGPFHVLVFYIWNAYFRPETWVWNAQWLMALKVSYVLGITAVVTTAFSKNRLRLTSHSFLIVVFLGHTLVSALLSPKLSIIWPYWVDFLKALTITLLIPTLVNDQRKLRILTFVMCLSLGFEGAKQGWVGMVLHPGGINNNQILFLGDNNGVAVGMLMLAPLFGALGATTRSRLVKCILYFLMIGVIYRALSTYSRGGFVSCGALAFIYWLRSKEKVRILIAIALTAAIVLPILPEAFWDRMNTITTYEEVEESSALSRFHFWEVATHMARDNPVFGVGFNAYNYTYNQYDFSDGQYGTGRSVHSAWFGVLSELGYVGFGIYVLILLQSLRNCWAARRIARQSSEFGELQRFAASFESSLWVFIVGGSFLPFQYNEMLWHVIGMSLALKMIATRGESPGGLS